jgi:hypothetical protein
VVTIADAVTFSACRATAGTDRTGFCEADRADCDENEERGLARRERE